MNTKPRILYTTSVASPQSGAFKMLLAMARSIETKGYDTILVFPEADDPYSFLPDEKSECFYTLDLPILQRKAKLGYYAWYLLNNFQSVIRLVRIICREQISIVHANEIFDLYAALAAMFTGRLCVWHIRAELKPWPMANWLFPRIVSLLADEVVVVSRSVQRHMFQEQGIGNGKVSVVYDPGPDFSQFHPSVEGCHIREEFGLDEDTFVISLVAKLSERKGHATLIRAVPEVLDSFPKTSFLIVGGELDGDHHMKYADKLKSLPDEIGVKERVIFTGFRSDIPQIMAASDIVTHCSTYPDPFPGVVLQGMAVGKPVVASDLGGPREQIINGESGLLVEPGRPSLLAGALCSLLEDEEKRTKLGKAALRRVKSEFSSEAYLSKLDRLYEGLI
jgi:glycosyltransferase involved in cell wall biosynthesis